MTATLLDVLGFETGLFSSTLTDTEFDAVSVVTGGVFQAASNYALPSGAPPLGPTSQYVLQTSTAGTSGAAYGERDWGSDQATISILLYVMFNVVPTALTPFCAILDSSAVAICDLCVSAAGLWALYNYGDTTTYISTGPTILAKVPYRIEVKLFGDSSTGTIDWKTNSVLEPGISALTGKNTKPGGLPRRYRVGVTTAQANAGTRYIDNVIVATDWIGNGIVGVMRPFKVDLTNWATNDASKLNPNFLAVVPWDGNTRIKSSAANQEERMGMMLGPNAGTILGLQAVIREKRALTGNASSVSVNIRSGSTDGTVATIDSGNQTYATKRCALQTTDPATSAAWTASAAANAKLRLVHDSGTNEADINGAFIYVAYVLPMTGIILPLKQATHSGVRQGQILKNLPAAKTHGNRRHNG